MPARLRKAPSSATPYYREGSTLENWGVFQGGWLCSALGGHAPGVPPVYVGESASPHVNLVYVGKRNYLRGGYESPRKSDPPRKRNPHVNSEVLFTWGRPCIYVGETVRLHGESALTCIPHVDGMQRLRGGESANPANPGEPLRILESPSES